MMYMEVRDVTKVIKGNVILDHISLELEAGKIYGLQGKNGSGKTMLMKAMCGLIFPTEGSVCVKGEILGKDRDFPESVGALIENPGFISNYTAFRNLKVLADIRRRVGEDEIRSILHEVGMDADSRKKYRQFSLGMKQKLGIAAALMEHPELILLDEPGNALDEESVKNLRGLLFQRREEGALIVIASHDAEELQFLADEIIVIENGKVKKRFLTGERSLGQDEKMD